MLRWRPPYTNFSFKLNERDRSTSRHSLNKNLAIFLKILIQFEFFHSVQTKNSIFAEDLNSEYQFGFWSCVH